MTKARTNADNASADIQGVTAGDGITGGGSSGVVTVAVSSDVLRTTGGQVISANTSANALEIRQTGAGNALVVEDDTNPDASPVVINTSGQLLVGKTTASTSAVINRAIQIEGLAASSTGMSIIRNSNDGSAAVVALVKSRGTTVGSATAVQSNDILSQISSYGADGTTQNILSANLEISVDGAVSTGIVPTRFIVFTANTSGVVTERMRIDSAGNVGIGVSSIVSPLQIGTSANASPQGNTGLTFRQGSGAPSAGSGYSVRWDNSQNVASDTGHIAYGFGGASGASSGFLRFSTSDSERLRIDGNGRITGANSAVLDIALVTNAQTASYTLVAADGGKLVEISNASANTVTIPTNASVPYAIGTQINILQTGAGQTTISGTSGVTVNSTGATGSAPKLRAQWSSATAIKRATDTWVVVGDIS